MHDVSCKSDHCPIEFSIHTQENSSLNRDASVETMNVDCGDDSFKLIKSEKTEELVSSMVNDAKSSENLIELDKNLKEGIISPNNAFSVLEQKLLNITEHSMKKIKTNTINKNSITSVKKKNDNSKSWYNQECKEVKKIMRKARKQFSYGLKNFPSTSQIVREKRTIFCQRRREYNSIKKKNENKFKFNESKRLINLCKENPKQFWQRMKVKSENNASTFPIKLDEFYKFFMKLSSENLEFKSDFDIKWQEHVDLQLESGSIAVASDELDKIISKIEITEAINELKDGKSRELIKSLLNS